MGEMGINSMKYINREEEKNKIKTLGTEISENIYKFKFMS